MLHPEKRRQNRKEIPMKPEKMHSSELFSESWWFRCPVCHEPVDYIKIECDNCHQTIDWSEDGAHK